MLFRRRLFYDISTGDVLRSYTMRGDLNSAYTAAQEAADLCLTNWACMEWIEPDPEIEAAFAPVDAAGTARSVSVTVDVSGAEPQLVFAYAPLPEAEPGEKADMAAALALLGVTPDEV